MSPQPKTNREEVVYRIDPLNLKYPFFTKELMRQINEFMRPTLGLMSLQGI